MDKKAAHPAMKLIFPVVIIVAVAAIFVASRNSNETPADEPATVPIAASPDAQDSTPAAIRYIDDLSGVHSGSGDYSATSCQGCHIYEYDDWMQSPHGEAMRGEGFQSALAKVVQDSGRDAARTCFACHAPHDVEMESLRDDGTLDLESIGAQGVNCFACHSMEIRVGRYLLDGDQEPDFIDASDPKFCASCHSPGWALLTTLDSDLAGAYGLLAPAGDPCREWLRSDYSQRGDKYKSCLDCHGQSGMGTVHRWPKDKPEMLRNACTVEVIAPARVEGSENEIRGGIRITNTGAGHAFPTGDPGRVVEIKVSLVDEEGLIAGDRWCALGSYEGFDVTKKEDTRLQPGESIEVVACVSGSRRSPEELHVVYRITYGYDRSMVEFLNGLGVEPEIVVIEEGG